MPLSSSQNRSLAHTRVVTCRGFQRADDLWDIEGRIVDTKPYGFANQDRGGWINEGEALHDMSIRLTVNLDLTVINAEAVIDFSPYNYCHSVVRYVENLIGLSVEPGWTNKSKQAMGSSKGCTHLTELLGPIATTAIQTISSARRSSNKGSDVNDEKMNGKDALLPFLNSCHSYQADSPIVKRYWPDVDVNDITVKTKD